MASPRRRAPVAHATARASCEHTWRTIASQMLRTGRSRRLQTRPLVMCGGAGGELRRASRALTMNCSGLARLPAVQRGPTSVRVEVPRPGDGALCASSASSAGVQSAAGLRHLLAFDVDPPEAATTISRGSLAWRRRHWRFSLQSSPSSWPPRGSVRSRRRSSPAVARRGAIADLVRARVQGVGVRGTAWRTRRSPAWLVLTAAEQSRGNRRRAPGWRRCSRSSTSKRRIDALKRPATERGRELLGRRLGLLSRTSAGVRRGHARDVPVKLGARRRARQARTRSSNTAWQWRLDSGAEDVVRLSQAPSQPVVGVAAGGDRSNTSPAGLRDAAGAGGILRLHPRAISTVLRAQGICGRCQSYAADCSRCKLDVTAREGSPAKSAMTINF